MDFTPGIFDITFGKTNVNERVQSTLPRNWPSTC
jgi:hypothetical protein